MSLTRIDPNLRNVNAIRISLIERELQSLFSVSGNSFLQGRPIWALPSGRRRLGATQLGAGHLGAVSQFYYFFSYEEETMKQAIP